MIKKLPTIGIDGAWMDARGELFTGAWRKKVLFY